jgi:hypothetical protein
MLRSWIRRIGLCVIALAAFVSAPGCERNTTTLDDRTLETRPLSETEKPVNKGDPFRP